MRRVQISLGPPMFLSMGVLLTAKGMGGLSTAVMVAILASPLLGRLPFSSMDDQKPGWETNLGVVGSL